MENFGYNMIGEMLIGLGNALKDEHSDLRKRFKLSREQLETLLGIIRIAASPDVQRRYICDLAERWRVSERTIKNWIEWGLIRPGHKIPGDTRHFWYADELDLDERNLIRRGYFKPQHRHHIHHLLSILGHFK